MGTSFLAILIISISALFATTSWPMSIIEPVFCWEFGGVAGAQIGARLMEHISTGNFKRILAFILIGLAAYLFFNR